MKTKFLEKIDVPGRVLARWVTVIAVGLILGLLPMMLGGIPGFTAPGLMFEPGRIFYLAAGVPLMGIWFGLSRLAGWMKEPDNPAWVTKAGMGFLPTVCRSIFFYFCVVSSFLCPFAYLGVELPDGLGFLGLFAGIITASGVVGMFHRFGWHLDSGWVHTGPSEVPSAKVFAWMGTFLVGGIVAGPEILRIASGASAPNELLGRVLAKLIAAFLIGCLVGNNSHGKVNLVALVVGIGLHFVLPGM